MPHRPVLPLSPRRSVALARAAGGLLILALGLLGCTRRDAPVPPEALRADLPDQETWDVALDLSLDERPRARVTAPYLARYEGADSTYTRFGPASDDSTRVVVHVFEDGTRTATVEADRLRYLDAERRFVAEGRVVVETETGKTLQSESLVWDEAERSLQTDGFVRIITPTERLQGYRLVADEALETYTLARITGQVTVEDG